MAYSIAAKIAAQEGIAAMLAVGSGNPTLRLYGGNTLLATFALSAGVISPVDGSMSLVADGLAVAVVGGTVTHADLVGHDNVPIYSALPAVEGLSDLAGSIVLSTSTLAAGDEIALLSGMIP